MQNHYFGLSSVKTEYILLMSYWLEHFQLACTLSVLWNNTYSKPPHLSETLCSHPQAIPSLPASPQLPSLMVPQKILVTGATGCVYTTPSTPLFSVSRLYSILYLATCCFPCFLPLFRSVRLSPFSTLPTFQSLTWLLAQPLVTAIPSSPPSNPPRIPTVLPRASRLSYAKKTSNASFKRDVMIQCYSMAWMRVSS